MEGWQQVPTWGRQVRVSEKPQSWFVTQRQKLEGTVSQILGDAPQGGLGVF